MEVHIPNYYPQFRCLAGRCPHTCCAWWEVPVDEASADFYRGVSGELGDRLRAALVRDGDGAPCFRLTGGQCPFLDEAGLCSLQLRWGERRIPAICREHPRFSYDYGSVREVGLCASCPEAARLVLGADFSLTARAGPQPEEESHPLLSPLLRARAVAFELLRDGALPLSRRLRALLLFGNDLQNALGGDDADTLDQIGALYAGGLSIPDDLPLPPRGEGLTAVFLCLRQADILQADWLALLDKALERLGAGQTPPPPPEIEGARAAAYFLYRHWLRALNDDDVLSWCELAVLGTAAAGALAPLAGGFAEAFRRFCLEIEHSQSNLDALQDALWHTLTLPQLLCLT